MKREIDPKAVSARLIRRMKDLDVSGADITRATGATSAAITKWRQGINAPTRYSIQLAELLQVTPEWLLYGEGEQPAAISEPRTPPRDSNIREFGRFHLWSSSDPLPKDEYAHLPFLKEVRMKGGAGNFELEDYNGYTLPFAKATLLRYGVDIERSFCCTLDGDSMEPVIPDGATIGISVGDDHIKDGKIYAFEHDGLFRVKRLFLLPGGQVRINSYNQDDPAYADEIVPLEEIRIVGRVFTWSVLT